MDMWYFLIICDYDVTVLPLNVCFLVHQMSVVGITENVKGDSKKFEIWCNSREEVYIVQVSAHNTNILL